MSLALEIKKPLEAITNPEDIPHFASVVASAFSNDVVNRYLYLGRDSRPDHPKLQPDLRAKYWERVITPRFQDRALLIQSHDWAAVALWLPPGVEKPPPNPAIVSEGGLEYRDFFDALRKEKLGSRLHWHLNLIARNPVRDDGGKI
ncbi:hypothetical protein P280DRAFT_470841 [Massarina eburnea CBS 473.64]|uniref:Uncharacterized protein n=1 Tax=Massarina eburnea CBS 473.64 TaxID=1395130 RepID=A0A6A6RTZ4_9PLEO|nr:hypothetical protein P280DRAFT_470841 [Massarina eburnea CBS 473.64]